MKKHIKRLPLYIPLAIVLLFLVVWGASLLKCEILTNRYHDELEYAHVENTMIGKINSFKVLKCDGETAEVYYVCDNNTVGNVLEYQKENGEWKEIGWNTIWSKQGSADEMLWPYWWHTYFVNSKQTGNTINTQSTNKENDRNGDGVVEPGELVDFQEPLPESELKFGVPEYKLSCEGVVYAKVVTHVLTDELEGEWTDYTETVKDKSRIQAFAEAFNSLLTTSTPDELDTWWCDDEGFEDSVTIYLYEADGSCIKVISPGPERIRLENNERRKISPYDRKALLDTIYDTEASFLGYLADDNVYKVDMPDKEFIEKAKTVTKDTDWLGFKDVFGKSGGFNCDRGYDYSYIHNGEYVLIVEEGYQAYLREFSDPSFRQKID